MNELGSSEPRLDTAAQRARSIQQVRWAGWGLLLAALLLYGLTMDNGLQPEELRGGDLITHQYAQVEARPGNAPGYPLYTMGGWLWFHSMRTLASLLGDPLPNPMPLLSAYSTLWALLTLWLLYRILCRLTRSPRMPAGDWPLAALLAGFYAVTYFFWYYATTTEQYSSAIAQTLAIVYLYLCWQDRQAESRVINAPNGSWVPAGFGMLLALALLSGLALAHMLTVAFIVPPLLLAILWQAPQLLRNWRALISAIAVAFLPLVSYLYVYLRGAAHPEWWGQGDWSSPAAWFWAFVSTSQGREELGWGFEAWCIPFANGFPALIGHELSWPVVLLGLIGLAWLGRRPALLCYGTLLIYLAFSWAYRCGNWFQVILPVYPLLLMGVAMLIQTLFLRLQRTQGRDKRAGLRIARATVILLIVAAIAWRMIALWPMTDSRDRSADTALDRAARLLARPLPREQRLFAEVDDALALQYLIHIWQLRPDLRVVSSPQASALFADGQTIYSTWEMASTLRAELPAELAVTAGAVDPDWVRFAPVALAETEPSITISGEEVPGLVGEQLLDQPIVPGLLLHRYAVAKPPIPALATYREPIAQGAQGLDLWLFWQLSAREWPAKLAISVRLTAGGEMIEGAQIDRALPGIGVGSETDGLLSDPYHFALSAAEVPTVDGALVILYRTTASGFENVAVLPLTWP